MGSFVTVEVSSGRETRRVPDVTGQTLDQATTNLKTAGFPIILHSPVDSILPLDNVVATDPGPGLSAALQLPIMLKVSRGNQFAIPNIVGMTYLEVVPCLQGLEYVGALLNGGDVPGPDEDRKPRRPAGPACRRRHQP